jgi:diaminopimelate epimerase
MEDGSQRRERKGVIPGVLSCRIDRARLWLCQASGDMISAIKAHAYGNDFLFVEEHQVADTDQSALARAMCERHRGIGADGLIVFRRTARGAVMRLLNADGSRAEVSGNGVRCLAAILVGGRLFEEETAQSGAKVSPEGPEVVIETDSGPKTLVLLGEEDGRYTFRASMGTPQQIRRLELDVDGEAVSAVALWMGNPQLVVLGASLEEGEFHRLGPKLERHSAFSNRTNVEFARVEAPDRIRIRIWERGVGPTESSGTGACAAAVVAASFGGAARSADIVSAGGTQRVEWREDGVYLTGWARVILTGKWIA